MVSGYNDSDSDSGIDSGIDSGNDNWDQWNKNTIHISYLSMQWYIQTDI